MASDVGLCQQLTPAEMLAALWSRRSRLVVDKPGGRWGAMGIETIGDRADRQGDDWYRPGLNDRVTPEMVLNSQRGTGTACQQQRHRRRAPPSPPGAQSALKDAWSRRPPDFGPGIEATLRERTWKAREGGHRFLVEP